MPARVHCAIGSQQLPRADGGGLLGRTALHGCAFKAKASLASLPSHVTRARTHSRAHLPHTYTRRQHGDPKEGQFYNRSETATDYAGLRGCARKAWLRERCGR